MLNNVELGISKEKAIIVGIDLGRNNFNESLQELKELSKTAGAEVVGELTQKRKKPNPKIFLGSGKLEELQSLKARLNADVIIFDNDLSPTQVRNLEEALACKVIDRTELILDIFAKSARTKEAELQVELAYLSYTQARLTGKGVLMSRLGGGIATRGPGETKLEYDRRRIKDRISLLKAKIKEVSQRRRSQKKHREFYPHLCLVGYTNAGKSSLMNALTHAGCRVESKLFTTLDPTRRLLILPNKVKLILIDTVGFIQNLPTHLIAAFSATLEEVASCDLLLHVVDINYSINEITEKIRVVTETLRKLKANQPVFMIFNKIDKLNSELLQTQIKRLQNIYPNSIAISALYNINIDKLIKILEETYPIRRIKLSLDGRDSKLYEILCKYGNILNKYQYNKKLITEVEISEYIYNKLNLYNKI
jgi:GTP-binding protein HflX